ncbi:putative P-loop containing nucleoside triphosphate hydrolase, leucine-rich repeat domain, L [Medicago truncatula]|uniref:Disease resistance protein RGA4 n=1 Tax=Medicago truncatula TaxID=3880 RepID=A0A072VDR4_MEDTR|nr:putative disease resistance protein RGA1 [Medicago truncatula]XP_024638175.1 putative disease resistance protein RGA1 [Medicago truncatula]KEH40164.1 disease resistance protein RGA4 [Medicago truncatula]RHN77485.1 putative P-loop containing nucleoside triphosphate hydrolase, leucine-rich repeat domain, L [Medicago truncatula]
MTDALLDVVFENLTSLLKNEFATLSGIKSKAEKLSTTLELIKAVLEDAEKKQLTDRSIQIWLQQLKDAVYVLDDILDECSIKGLSSFKPKNVMFRHYIGSRLNEITSRLSHIAEGKKNFMLREGVTVTQQPTEVAEWRQTSSFIAEPKMFGREDDKEKIVEFLLTQAKDSDFLSVYPIVGLGGVGKTTLSQLVYNDDRVSDNFKTKIWVCVSEVFSVKGILCSIIESMTKQKCDSMELDVIQRKVQEMMQGTRCLLVLDDVWNKNEEFEFGLNQEKWNKLKSVLSCGSKGTSVLVSTRDMDVASITGTCPTRPLSVLSDHECWLLFKQYAFGHYREERAELVKIGKEIVKKCGGLPLAAQALGCLMHSRSEEKAWLEIKESEIWALPHENSILPALRLSYFHLSPTLKQCFAFCAIFRKDTKIMKEELIHLWMANGFISSRKNLEVEDVGNMIWNELYQKSFFQDIHMDDYSRVISFKMHDLVHDLAQSVGGQECMVLDNAYVTNLSKSTHHISFNYPRPILLEEDSFTNAESLRTLYNPDYFRFRFGSFIPIKHTLRVLRTDTFEFSLLGSLIHLRYLELHNFGIKPFPNSVYNLQRLEILKLRAFTKLSCLPEHLSCLQNLRHLIIEGCNSLSRMFPHIGKLSCLRTLSVYIVNFEKGHSLAELRDLNLGGKLEIKGLQNVGSLSEAKEANLMGKKDLDELCLSWKGGDTPVKTPVISDDQVIEVLQPHTNLKSLKIHSYQGLCFPSWIRTLSNLVTLEVGSCNHCERFSSLGKLPYLKKLILFGVSVKYLDDNEFHNGMEVRIFPSLETLLLRGMPNLEGLLKVERDETFPCLSILEIDNCPKLELPCLPSVRDLYVDECNNKMLKSISSFYGLTTLTLYRGEGITSFPKEFFRNFTSLQTLSVGNFQNLKELPNERFNLALEHLQISCCCELEYLPEKIWGGLQSLQSMRISYCERLKCLPDGIRHLTALDSLTIVGCPTLTERCKEGTGEDWDKIAHIPKLKIS